MTAYYYQSTRPNQGVVQQLLRRIAKGLKPLIVGLSGFYRSLTYPDLSGDRDIEWSWVAAHLPEEPGIVLDFGCGNAFLGLIAAMKGNTVTGLDLEQIRLPFKSDNLEIRSGDILSFDFGETRFDVIINCSSIEHVGLAGRYGSADVPDGDLMAMERLRGLLKVPTGTMILTVPVGKDSVFPPLHRVYGVQRLDLLLHGFQVIEKQFWSKRSDLNVWVEVSEEEALSLQPSESLYALGLFVLKPEAAL
ncbi:MAG: DUF268 domain-containing protein [Chloroflexi bacterium]|nr:DUF268 domain-containing protein [Chloroflexota bacterium]MCL5075298.1 DUF268 domain-containing protein [Chloroflexota bacterium]